MTYVFVYGTLKRRYGNNCLLRTSEFVGEAATIEPMCIYDVGIPVVTLAKTAELKEYALPIVGEVYRVSDSVLSDLDILEGHPDLYTRIEKRVTFMSDRSNMLTSMYVILQDLNYNLLPTNNIVITENGYQWGDSFEYDPICF